MAPNPKVLLRGIDKVIRRDLEKHRSILGRCHTERASYREARSLLIQRKKHYRRQLGGGKYDDEALRNSMGMIAIDIRAMSDKIDLTDQAIDHHQLIVDTLSQQLVDYDATVQEAANASASGLG